MDWKQEQECVRDVATNERLSQRSLRRREIVVVSGAAKIVCWMGLLCVAVMVAAQQPKPVDNPGTKPENPAKDVKDEKTPAASSVDQLAVSQDRIADKYARLEQLLIRMAELEATSNPQRAALLKRAVQQSSDRLTHQQLATLVKLLTPPTQLKRAIDEQQETITDLKALLELLQSEDRFDRLKREQDRVRDYIKEVERIIRLQKGVQGRTEGGDDAAKLADDQKQVADRTGGLAQRIQKNEEGKQSAGGDPKNANKQGADKEGAEKDPANKSQPGDSDKSPSNDKNPDGSEKPGNKKDNSKSSEKSADKAAEKSKDDAQQSSDSKNGKGKKGTEGESSKDKSKGKQESGDSQKGSEQKSKSSPGQPGEQGDEPMPDSGESPPPQDSQQEQENPARKRLQAAEDRMREAQKKLAETKRDDAAQEQEKAREELEKAKAELEQILRQIREEEIERTLALLEGRFRRMLDSQLKINESTKRLDKIMPENRTRDVDLQSSKLGYDEGKLAAEADKALLLLHEEGSSVAFPETVEMMRDDMQQVADRLASTKVDNITQGIEEEIVQALEELIAALQLAQKQMKDKRQQQQQQQPMDPGSRPLVDKLAELKMIRSLQVRVNTRTQRFSRLLEDADDPVGRANDGDLRQSITKLAELEHRVFEITRNIVLGKNE